MLLVFQKCKMQELQGHGRGFHPDFKGKPAWEARMCGRMDYL
jgi:hypothetical protein